MKRKGLHSSKLDFFEDPLLEGSVEKIGNDRKPGLVNILLSLKDQKVETRGSNNFLFYQIWKPMLNLEPDEDIFKVEVLESLSKLLERSQNSNVVIVNYHGGDFSIIAFDPFSRGKIIGRKSFHKYVVRKKQGGKQSKRKRQGTSGSQMRMLNMKKLVEDIEGVFSSIFWIEQLQNSRFIGLLCPGHENRKFIVQQIRKALGKHSSSKILHHLPFRFKKANFTNTKAAYNQLVRVIVWRSSCRRELEAFFEERCQQKRKKNKNSNEQNRKKKKKKKKKKGRGNVNNDSSSKKKKKKKKSKDLGLDDILFSPLSEYISPVLSPVLSSASSVLSSAGSLLSPILSPLITPISSFFRAGEEKESDIFLQAIEEQRGSNTDSQANSDESDDRESLEEEEEEGELYDIAGIIEDCSNTNNSEFEVVREEFTGEGSDDDGTIEEEEDDDTSEEVEEVEEESLRLERSEGGSSNIRSSEFPAVVVVLAFLILSVVTISVLIMK